MTHVFRFLLLTLAFVCAAAPARAAETAISEAEAEQFGHEFSAYFNEGRAGEIFGVFDLMSLGNRAVAGMDIPDKERTELVQGLVQGMRTSLGKQLAVWTSARFIRVLEVDGEKRILVRVLSEEGAFNFFEAVCARKASGSLKAVDLHTYLTGELMSLTVRRALLPAISQLKGGILERLGNKDQSYLKSLEKMQQGTQALMSEEFEKALNIFEALPDSLRNELFVLTQRLMAAQRCEEKRYLAVIDDWRKAYPNSSTLDMVSIDGCVMRKDFKGAAAHLVALQKRTGPDAHLEVLRGNILGMGGERAEALEIVKKAVALEPKLQTGYAVWMTLERDGENWKGVITALDAFTKEFPNLDFWPVIEGDEAWAAFRNSDECKAWRAKK